MFEFSFMLACFLLHLSHNSVGCCSDSFYFTQTNTIVTLDGYHLSAIILFSDTRYIVLHTFRVKVKIASSHSSDMKPV